MAGFDVVARWWLAAAVCAALGAAALVGGAKDLLEPHHNPMTGRGLMGVMFVVMAVKSVQKARQARLLNAPRPGPR